MKYLYLLFFTFFINTAISQIIKGKVLDEQNQPLYGANVFFDGSTIATIADENGYFELNVSSKSSANLVISFIGYQTVYITNYKFDSEFTVILKEEINTLNVVTISKDKFTRKQKVKLFREQFLGVTSNSRKTKILNEDAIYFDYDEKNLVLKAFSDVPLQIKNEALEYNITYELVDFEANFYKSTMKSTEVIRSYYAGISRFEDFLSNTKTLKKRNKSYEGSQLHFFRNLVNNIWDKNNFLLFKGSFQDSADNNFKVTDEGDNKKVVVTKQNLGISNKNTIAEFNLLFDKKMQSKIIFETDTFYVDKFGNNSNIENIIFTGYLTELKVGDMLPMNYNIK